MSGPRPSERARARASIAGRALLRRPKVRGPDPTRRPATVARRQIASELRWGDGTQTPTEHWRPQRRRECAAVARPCPYVGCRHHLYLDVNSTTGSLTYNHPGLEPWEMGESCALDSAERGERTLEAVGEALNLTKERVRQVQDIALARIRDAMAAGEASLPNPEE